MIRDTSIAPPEADPRPFVKVYQSGFDRLERLVGHPSGPIVVRMWTFLVRYAGRENALVASNEVIADCLGVGVRTVKRGIAALKETGAIEVYKLATANCYVLSPEEVYRDREETKQFTSFRVRALVGFKKNPDLRASVDAVPRQPHLPDLDLPE